MLIGSFTETLWFYLIACDSFVCRLFELRMPSPIDLLIYLIDSGVNGVKYHTFNVTGFMYEGFGSAMVAFLPGCLYTRGNACVYVTVCFSVWHRGGLYYLSDSGARVYLTGFRSISAHIAWSHEYIAPWELVLHSIVLTLRTSSTDISFSI